MKNPIALLWFFDQVMLVLKGYFAVKIQPSEETVPSIELIACLKYTPLFIKIHLNYTLFKN